MRKIIFKLHIRFTHRKLRSALVIALLAMTASDLASESVMMTTYYPSPSGVYVGMAVTENAYLPRDSGGVGIGTKGSLPQSVLDVQSTTSAFLPPRMSSAQQAAIPAASLKAGSVVYVTDPSISSLEFYNGSTWINLSSPSGRTKCPSGWGLVGTPGSISSEVFCVQESGSMGPLFTWPAARTNCGALGAHLCTYDEWAEGCAKIFHQTIGPEWVSDYTQSGFIATMGVHNCSGQAMGQDQHSYWHYRCCMR